MSEDQTRYVTNRERAELAESRLARLEREHTDLLHELGKSRAEAKERVQNDNYRLIYFDGGERREKAFKHHADLLRFVKRDDVQYASSAWPDKLKLSRRR